MKRSKLFQLCLRQIKCRKLSENISVDFYQDDLYYVFINDNEILFVNQQKDSTVNISKSIQFPCLSDKLLFYIISLVKIKEM